jgi:hypothetical protein
VNPLELYLTELREIHDSGAVTRETSGYPALAKLLDAAGHALKPKVRCLIQLRNNGAGLPDGGLFTSDQLKQTSEPAPLLGLAPARGVIEVKSASEEIAAIAQTEQIKNYLSLYGQLLLTNYRDFLLLKRAGNTVQPLEGFRLADSEAAFWAAAAHPRKTADALGERFYEYLKRVLLHAAPLNNPRDVAFFLASYARDARARVEHAGDLPALAAIRAALEEAIGMKFEAGKGEHFFRSTLVQTLFYGVFSAWVLWHKEKPRRTDAFDWKAAAWTLHVPMIKALFEQVATPTKLGPLGLVEVLDWTAAALNRVDRPAFFEKFLETHAVQYFYEPFLEAFDPELRKELGVWYTPPEIVEYQVERVDTVLREELDIPDGLADPRVFVLDLCCGTAAYLVQVIRRIVQTIREEKHEGSLSIVEAKQAAMKRVYGFEIMPAPFVVAHLQMGLLLQSLGVPLDDSKSERAGIFLTNSLTGWDFAGDNPHLAQWPELAAEAKGAGIVKKEKPILVILGNPPYNAYAGVSPDEEQGLVEPYKDGLVKDWGIKKFNLDDLYIRFFRLAERRIAEKTGKGIVCYISNFSYLGDPSFVVMRQRFLAEFDTLWFDCLNGDSRETGKLTPEGKPDPSVFSTEFNREGIRVGTAVGLLVRQPKRCKKARVFFRQFWGVNKRAEILDNLHAGKIAKQYQELVPDFGNRFTFLPSKVAKSYLRWPRIPDLAAVPAFNGPVERRAMALIAIEKPALISRIAAYFDNSVTNDQIARIFPSLMMTGNRIVGPEARKKILGKFSFDESRIVRYPFKPYDIRWCYLENLRPLFSEPSPQLLEQRFKGNTFFITRDTADKDIEGPPFYYSSLVCDYDCISGHARHFPVCLRTGLRPKNGMQEDGNGELGSILHEAACVHDTDEAKTTANLSRGVRTYLADMGIKNPDAVPEIAALIWMHALAIGFSPVYLKENADGIRQDWPRVPLPATKAALLASAELGRQIAALLDTEASVPSVTAGKVRPELKTVAEPHCSSAPDFRALAGWGHAGKEGVTMPGKGKLLTRAYRPEEQPAKPHLGLLGKATHDIYLNDTAYWRNVPEKVWDFTIGGYQVMKKWLSYREHALLGRALRTDEIRELTHTARRLAALILLQPELDANYQRSKAGSYPWTP